MGAAGATGRSQPLLSLSGVNSEAGDRFAGLPAIDSAKELSFVVAKPFQTGVLQYVVAVTPATVLTAAVCRWTGQYSDDYGRQAFNPSFAYLYVALVLGFSQLWALGCVARWFRSQEFESKSPRQLIWVVVLVFWGFWQELLTLIFGNLGWLDGLSLECRFGLPQESFAWGTQAVLIICELFIGALMLPLVFPHEI